VAAGSFSIPPRRILVLQVEQVLFPPQPLAIVDELPVLRDDALAAFDRPRALVRETAWR